jgi:hypothetical protein
LSVSTRLGPAARGSCSQIARDRRGASSLPLHSIALAGESGLWGYNQDKAKGPLGPLRGKLFVAGEEVEGSCAIFCDEVHCRPSG